MITIAPATAFMLYLAALLALLTLVWCRSSRKRCNRLRLPQETLLLVCEYCHYVYLDSANVEVTTCPQCRSFNKHNPYRKANAGKAGKSYIHRTSKFGQSSKRYNNLEGDSEGGAKKF